MDSHIHDRGRTVLIVTISICIEKPNVI